MERICPEFSFIAFDVVMFLIYIPTHFSINIYNSIFLLRKLLYKFGTNQEYCHDTSPVNPKL